MINKDKTIFFLNIILEILLIIYIGLNFYLLMKKEINFKLFIICLEEVLEEIEIQFYGIASSIFFYVIVYLFFHPPWMKPLIDFFYKF